MLPRSAVALLFGTTLCACSTLSTQVQTSATEYGSVMEEFSNQVLLTNVLRARDQAPLNFSALPLIRGSLSLQGTGALTIPFGPRSAVDGRNSFAPTIQFTTSPTFDTSSLNTQAFTANLIQPISPVFIESIWSAGFPKELLLYLFVESIQPGVPKPKDASSPAPAARPAVHNNPDSSKAFADFVGLVNGLVASQAELRSFTVLEPVGLPLQVKATEDSVFFNDDKHETYLPILLLDPGRFKVAYVKRKKATGFQVYRRYPSQIALCVSNVPLADASEAFKSAIESLNSRAESPDKAGSLRLFIDRSRGAPAALPREFGALASAASKIASSEANVSLATATQAYRASGILIESECNSAEQVSPLPDDPALEEDSRYFGYLRWRSTADVYRYLGALLRNKDAGGHSPTWVDADKRTHRLFSVPKSSEVPSGRRARITVNYLDSRFSVVEASGKGTNDDPIDHSLQVLSLLSQLVNIAKVSADIPRTSALQVLP